MGLQETIKRKYYDDFFRVIDPSKAFTWNWIPSIGRSGGILCGIKTDRFNVLKAESGKYYIMAHLFDKKLKIDLNLATVYSPAQEDEKAQFLTELSHICAVNKYPLLVGGDFNILRFSSEKNKNFKGNKYSDLFNWVINTYEMRDLGLSGGKYTWSNNHGRKKNTLENWTEFW